MAEADVFQAGDSAERINIHFRDGSQIELTSGCIENYYELKQHLAARPEYVNPERYSFSKDGAAAVETSTTIESSGIDRTTKATVPPSQKSISELPRMTVSLDLLSQTGEFLAPVLTVGLGIFLIVLPFFIRPKGQPLPTTEIVLMVVAGFGIVALGYWLFFYMRRKSVKVPRTFSAEGIGLKGGSVVPWESVLAITDAVATRGYSGGGTRTVRQTKIRLRDGKELLISSDTVYDFDDVHAYLAKLPFFQGN
jgi:hypothetical protein